LKCLGIEERADQILAFCGRLEQDMERFATEYDTLGRHIINARSKYEEGARKLDRLRARLERASDIADQDELADDSPPVEAIHLRRV
jgi:DNA anti-recombination protein RmuC